MRRTCAFAVLISAFAFASLAWAEDVIHFTNGTSMPVSSYRIEGDMVQVDLGGNAIMAFPKSLIESFEKTDQVRIAPSSPKQGSGRMIASSRTDAGGGGRASRVPEVQAYNSGVETVAPPTPPANNAFRGRQVQNAVAGWGGAPDNSGQGGNLHGAQRVGSHYVMDSGSGGGVAPSKKRVGLEPAIIAEPFQPPPAPEAPPEVEQPSEPEPPDPGNQ